MREILFRGKRADNGKWALGFPMTFHNNLSVEGILRHDGKLYRINKSTMGECTWLTDQYGTLIFEGDIVVYDGKKPMEIRFDNGGFILIREDTFYERLDIFVAQNSKIVGNIHDNPELIGGGEDG